MGVNKSKMFNGIAYYEGYKGTPCLNQMFLCAVKWLIAIYITYVMQTRCSETNICYQIPLYREIESWNWIF